MKLNKIDEVSDIENLLSKWIFGLLSSEILLPWQRNVTTSPLYWFFKKNKIFFGFLEWSSEEIAQNWKSYWINYLLVFHIRKETLAQLII